MANQPVTREKLINADIDVDNLGKAVNEEAIVTPRYGDQYKSAPLAIKEIEDNGIAAVAALNAKADQVVAQGFYQGYTTEALLLAAKPAVAEMRARADDTRKIYRWNRTSAEGVTPVTGTWVDTGLSDKDLAAVDATTKANAAEANAKNYTKTLISEAVDFSKNTLLLAQADFVSGYLRNDGVVQALGGFSYTSNFILLNSFYQYVVEGSPGSSLGDAGTCFYDVNKNFISGIRTSTLTNGVRLSPPANAAYVRFGIKTDSTGLFNVRVSSKTISDIEANIRNPLIYPVEADTLLTENRNPNNLTTATVSSASAVVQFAKQDFPFLLKSANVLMPASGKADIYLYKVNSATSVTKVKKVASLVNTKNEISNVTTEFGNGLFVPTGYFLAYQRTSGSFLFTTNSAQNTSFVNFYASTQPPEEGASATVVAADFTSNFYIPMILRYKKLQYSNMEMLAGDLVALKNKDIQLDEKITELNKVTTKKHEYISVYHDNFKQSALQTNWEDSGSNWSFDFDKGEVKPTAIGGSSYSGGTIRTNTLRLKSIYNANKRSAMMRVSFAANTVLEIATTSQFTTGMRIFRVDFANALLQEYSTNGTTLLSSTPITIPLVVGKQYIVRLDVDRLQESFQIMDYITGASTSMIKNSITTGDIQLAHYTLALKSGSPFTMYEFDVSVKNRPKVYIVGDSITAQEASGVEGWAYRFTDLLQGNVVISAQGSTNGFNVPLLIESEAKHIKPDILLWCHGHNGGVTQANLDNVKALCEQYGIKMYVNHVTCSGANNHLAINELIEKNGFKGARFDIATARDSNPYPVEGDSAIRADSSLYRDVSIHPNAAGNQKMFERLAIDLPELLY